MSARSPHPSTYSQWITVECESLRALVAAQTARHTADGLSITWSEGGHRREIMATLLRDGAMSPSIIAVLEGMTKPSGWRLRAIFPNRTGIDRASMTAGTTAAAAAAITRWTTSWMQGYATQPSVPSTDVLQAAATADLVAGTQALAARLRATLAHRLALRSPTVDTLVQGLDAMAQAHLAASDADDLVSAVNRLLLQNAPLEGDDCETLSDLLDVPLPWLVAGEGHSPLL